jgi:methionine-rich copper-binding protein CopC
MNFFRRSGIMQAFEVTLYPQEYSMFARCHSSTLKATAVLLCLPILLVACSTPGAHSPLLSAEPAIDAVLTRPPRTLRLFFAALPDVSRSNITLLGPAGEYQLRGLHTMAADDLMIEILEPAATPGGYTVQWSTVVGDDPMEYTGSFAFHVQAN